MVPDGQSFVLDASVLLKWVLDSEQEPGYQEARKLLAAWIEGSLELFLPGLWVYEAGNVLCLKRPQQAQGALAGLIGLGIHELPMTGELASTTISIATEYSVTFYDAAYLAVAREVDAQLLTADLGFARKASADPRMRTLVPL